jgi:hypothetical protein
MKRLLATLILTSLTVASFAATKQVTPTPKTTADNAAFASCPKLTEIETRTCDLKFCFATHVGAAECTKIPPSYATRLLVRKSKVSFENEGKTIHFEKIDTKSYEKFKYFIVNSK